MRFLTDRTGAKIITGFPPMIVPKQFLFSIAINRNDSSLHMGPDTQEWTK